MKKCIEKIYYIIDEIVKHGIKKKEKRGRKSKLTMSKVITILVEGHGRGFLTKKQLYELAIGELRFCFKEIPCYVQFTRSTRRAIPYLDLMIRSYAFTES